MINETVILLAVFEDCSKHRLARYVGDYLTTPFSCEHDFYEPLREIFSRVIAYDYQKRMIEVGVKGVNEEIIGLVRKEHPKYVIWLSAYYEFRESTFESIRKEGAIVVGWFFDDDFCFDEQSKWWIPYLDYCVTNTLEAVPKYRELGAKVLQAIPDTGIPVNRDWSNIEEKYDVSFVGLRDAYREQYIDELKKKKIPVHLYGEGWERRVPYEEMVDIFKTSKISLNFSEARYGNKRQIKGRVFHVCLAGGFMLTEYAPGIENYFEIDKEIVCFKNADEMIGKIVYYLNHDTERRAIARAGWERATREHDSFHVISRVFDEIEKDIASREEKGGPIRMIKTPKEMRRGFSDYYFNWGNAFSQENYKGLWQDAFLLSILYNPFNIRAWLYYIIGFLPYFLRRALIRLYKVVEKFVSPHRSVQPKG